MKAKFFFTVPNARILRNKTDSECGIEVEYVVERTIVLGQDAFIYFREHLLEDYPTISLYNNDMFVDNNGVWHVVMFCSMCADIMLLVNSEGYDYARHVAIKINGGEQIEKRFTTNQRYTRRRKANR